MKESLLIKLVTMLLFSLFIIESKAYYLTDSSKVSDKKFSIGFIIANPVLIPYSQSLSDRKMIDKIHYSSYGIGIEYKLKHNLSVLSNYSYQLVKSGYFASTRNTTLYASINKEKKLNKYFTLYAGAGVVFDNYKYRYTISVLDYTYGITRVYLNNQFRSYGVVVQTGIKFNLSKRFYINSFISPTLWYSHYKTNAIPYIDKKDLPKSHISLSFVDLLSVKFNYYIR